MAAGDAIGDIQSVAAAGYLTIQPGAGVEWSIHNLYWGGAVEVSKYDGTLEVIFHKDGGYGGFLGSVFNLTNTDYLRVKNTTAAAISIGYDGVATK